MAWWRGAWVMAVIGSVPDSPVWRHDARAMTASPKLLPPYLIICVARSLGHLICSCQPAIICRSRKQARPRVLFLIRVGRIGQPVCWLLGAVGRIYLAYCPEAEREAILKRLRKSEALEDRLARDSRRLDRILAETRQRGYGTRDTSFGGGAYKGPPVDDGLAAIAVALVGRNRVYGSINILFTRSASTVEAFADRHLLHLRDAAAEIVSALEVARSGGRRPR